MKTNRSLATLDLFSLASTTNIPLSVHVGLLRGPSRRFTYPSLQRLVVQEENTGAGYKRFVDFDNLRHLL